MMNFSPINKVLSIAAGLVLTAVAAQAKLNVVATTPDLGALAQEIGGDQIELTTLAKPTEDPHFIDPKPSYIVKLNRADVLIHGGADLEIGWLPPLMNGARNPKIVPGGPGEIRANEGVTMLDVPAMLDRSKGDVHAAGNPHFLVDPRNADIVCRHLTERFCKLDPGSCAVYRANLEKFERRLEAKLVEWQKAFEPYQGRQFVAYHNSWRYFGQRFGLKSDLFLEPKPGIPPTPTHLAEVITRMKQEKVRVILVDPYLNRRTAETVAARTGAKVIDVAQYPGGVKGVGAGYLDLMNYLVGAITKAMAE